MNKLQAKKKILEYLKSNSIEYRFLNEEKKPITLDSSDTIYFCAEIPDVIGKHIETTIRFKDEHLYCQSYYCQPVVHNQEEAIRAARIVNYMNMHKEVEHIIKYNDKHGIKIGIQEKGKDAYGEVGYTHTIKRLFEIINADPKNKALLREVNRAEEELIAFLYDDPGTLSEKEIFEYWNNYMWAYVAELEYAPCVYFLMVGYDENYHTGEWIGIYHSLTKAKEAYDKAMEKLQVEHQKLKDSMRELSKYTLEHEKVMIHVFYEKDGKWSYDIDFDNLPQEKHKEGDDQE